MITEKATSFVLKTSPHSRNLFKEQERKQSIHKAQKEMTAINCEGFASQKEMNLIFTHPQLLFLYQEKYASLTREIKHRVVREISDIIKNTHDNYLEKDIHIIITTTLVFEKIITHFAQLAFQNCRKIRQKMTPTEEQLFNEMIDHAEPSDKYELRKHVFDSFSPIYVDASDPELLYLEEQAGIGTELIDGSLKKLRIKQNLKNNPQPWVKK